MEKAPPLDHAARFSRGGSRGRVHKTLIGRHDHEHRVGPIYEQDQGSEQPPPFESSEKGYGPKKAADDGQARLHHVAAPIGQLPLNEEGAIVELKACGLLGEVDVDRGRREWGGDRERKMS